MPRKAITQPQEFWDAWEAQSKKDGAESLSAWIAERCNAGLEKSVQASLPKRNTTGRPTAVTVFAQRFGSLKPKGQVQILRLASKYLKQSIESLDELLDSWDDLQRSDRLRLEGLVDSLD